ncbi:MAG: family 43 glycosylhydrolase [Mobilitalea sp.]
MKAFYRNPIAKNGDFADPFIIKYNGTYYLYCTNPDVKCWSSKDLLSWIDEGTVIPPEVFGTLVPFAPEVVYWNGYFYMYTSPSGFGHYVLRSENPTGPFYKISENIGHSIDGSVFIDDDDQWYFYWADDEGIKACKMKDPVSLGETCLTEAFMEGWTEGPFIVKRDDRYYLTYTGNHYLSAGYRVNYAVSENPLFGFRPYEDNPILVNTEGTGVGLGHSCTIIGPDLATYFIVYHNLNQDASRDLNIDRLGWTGDQMVVFGPTQADMPAPKQAQFFDYCNSKDSFDYWTVLEGNLELQDGYLNTQDSNRTIAVCKSTVDRDYSAEFNLKARQQNTGAFGVIISYLDPQNYGEIAFDSREGTVEVSYVSEGKIIENQQACLANDYDVSKLHCIRVEQTKEGYQIFVDHRLKLKGCIKNKNHGCIGIYSTDSVLSIGYTALHPSLGGSNVYTDAKPVPGRIYAVHEKSLANHILCNSFTESLVINKENPSCEYNICVSESGMYNVDILVSEFHENTKIVLEVDEERWSIIDKPNLTASEFSMKYISKVSLNAGEHTFKIHLLNGSTKLHYYEFYKTSSEIHNCYDKLFSKEELHQIGPYCKKTCGEAGWNNYLIDVTVQGESDLNAGIIFRVTNLSEGGEGNDPYLGRNFYIGYFVGIMSDQLVLVKQNYNEKLLVKAEGQYLPGVNYHLRVNVKDNEFNIYLDDMEQPKISYTDMKPISHGRVGVRANGAVTEFSDFVCKLL